ncbi:MAG TPA: T9SS type A sorting domain-containing protein, partial [Bacteroidales bacterium]|nr:T9SS type A sorting domain-containing protein [Bacteroidales bacterium]
SDASGSPSGLLGVSAATTVNSSSGWQTVSLSSPVSVSSGQTVWLSWVFERTVGVRYTTGKPSRAQSSEAWSGGLPSSFGSSSLADYKYSVYCSYRTGYSQTSGDANQNPKRAVKDFAMMDDNTEKSSDTDDTGNDEMTLNLYPAEGTNKRMIVYPNPTSGNVTVSFEEASEDRHLLLIYDLQGRLVKTVNVEPWNYNIDVSIFDRKKGIYLFILKDMTNGTILNRSRVKKN